eukprot:TRINITY_DN67828_c3_g4_i1.p1 TRINITY_DN67828_c3_g4~~TRINITY_DN67828_c3_g4_i1.p1  ORF type:complete len:472 (-),score=34.80 TRINITY_DN67828_c3_g4_i1:183-1460(-)
MRDRVLFHNELIRAIESRNNDLQLEQQAITTTMVFIHRLLLTCPTEADLRKAVQWEKRGLAFPEEPTAKQRKERPVLTLSLFHRAAFAAALLLAGKSTTFKVRVRHLRFCFTGAEWATDPKSPKEEGGTAGKLVREMERVVNTSLAYDTEFGNPQKLLSTVLTKCKENCSGLVLESVKKNAQLFLKAAEAMPIWMLATHLQVVETAVAFGIQCTVPKESVGPVCDSCSLVTNSLDRETYLEYMFKLCKGFNYCPPLVQAFEDYNNKPIEALAVANNAVWNEDSADPDSAPLVPPFPEDLQQPQHPPSTLSPHSDTSPSAFPSATTTPPSPHASPEGLPSYEEATFHANPPPPPPPPPPPALQEEGDEPPPPPPPPYRSPKRNKSKKRHHSGGHMHSNKRHTYHGGYPDQATGVEWYQWASTREMN